MDATNMLLARADGDNLLSAFKFYYYEPSMAAAVIFIFIFALTTILHTVQMTATKTWFMIPFVVGGIFEMIGYIGRALSANENPGSYTLGPYIIQAILLLVAPPLFAASIYMELGRIVMMVQGERALFVRRTWLTKIFVTGDVLSFLMQSSGGGLLASGSAESINTGNNVIIAGLFVQIIFFALFLIAGIVFHIRIRRNPTIKCAGTPWERHLWSMYIVSILIFVRSIVRVVEYLQGYDGYIITHEAFLYIFDGVVMFFAMIVMNWIHPSEVAACLRGGKAFTNAWRLEQVGHTGRFDEEIGNWQQVGSEGSGRSSDRRPFFGAAAGSTSKTPQTS